MPDWYVRLEDAVPHDLPEPAERLEGLLAQMADRPRIGALAQLERPAELANGGMAE